MGNRATHDRLNKLEAAVEKLWEKVELGPLPRSGGPAKPVPPAKKKKPPKKKG